MISLSDRQLQARRDDHSNLADGDLGHARPRNVACEYIDEKDAGRMIRELDRTR